jgi:hypothetical protein
VTESCSLLGSRDPIIVLGSALSAVYALSQYCPVTVDALADKRLLLIKSGLVDRSWSLAFAVRTEKLHVPSVEIEREIAH